MLINQYIKIKHKEPKESINLIVLIKDFTVN